MGLEDDLIEMAHIEVMRRVLEPVDDDIPDPEVDFEACVEAVVKRRGGRCCCCRRPKGTPISCRKPAAAWNGVAGPMHRRKLPSALSSDLTDCNGSIRRRSQAGQETE